MEKHLRKRISLRYRYLLSFFIMALIPVVIILVSFYRLNIKQMKIDMESINTNRLMQIKSGIESKVMELDSLAIALTDHQTFLPLIKRNRIPDQYESLRIFSEFLSYRNVDIRTGIFLPESDLVYVKQGISSKDAYFSYILQLNDLEKERILSTLDRDFSSSRQTVLSIRPQNNQEFLLFAYPMPKYTTKPVAILLAVMNQSVIDRICNTHGSDLAGSVFICDENGKCIYMSNVAGNNEGPKGMDYADRMQEKKKQLEMQMENSKNTNTNTNPNNAILYAYSDYSGLGYGIVQEEDGGFIQVVRQTTLIWQIVFFALVIGLIFVVLLTVLTYMPMKRLLQFMDKGDGLRGDEYSFIREAIVKASQKSDSLEELLEVQQPYVLERLLEYALYAESTPEQIKQLFTSTNTQFEFEVSYVFYIRMIPYQGAQSTFFKNTVISYINEKEMEDSRLFSIEYREQYAIIIVVNCKDDSRQKEISGVLIREIMERLGADYRVTAGVGQTVRSIEYLKQSLYEAKILAEQNSGQILSFSEDGNESWNNNVCVYPTKLMDLFQMQLHQGDGENAKKSFSGLCEIAFEKQQSMLMSKYLSYYIVNTIAETVQKENRDVYEELSEQFMQFMEADHPVSFAERGNHIIEKFCHIVVNKKNTENNQLKQDLIQYIQDNITNPDLSLEKIAEEFDLSTFYISRLFREQKNINFKDYIADMRIQYAKKLLKETSLSINEIVEKTGYYSSSSFIRKFKSMEGVTPGEYRKHAQSE